MLREAGDIPSEPREDASETVWQVLREDIRRERISSFLRGE